MIFTRNGKGNECIKTIVIPEYVKKFSHPHYPVYKMGYYSVNTNGEPVYSWFNYIEEYAGININHHFTKSREQWPKSREMGRTDVAVKRMSKDFYEHDNNGIKDYAAFEYLDEVIKEYNRSANLGKNIYI